MRRTFVFLLVSLIIAQFTLSADAGIEWLSGGEPGIWGGGRDSLIVARVKDVETLKQDGDETATHILSLEPIFAAAGAFDPSEHALIKARAAIAVYGSWVRDAPSKGSLVLTVITPGNIGHDDARPFPWVATEICNFMPDKEGLVILKGVDDERVHETLERIRKAHAAGEAEAKAAAKAAETQPAPKPDLALDENPKSPTPETPKSAPDPHASTR